MPSPEQPPAAAPAPQLSIIIVTHNSAGVIGACLTSLYRSDPALALEVIVVDNASSDGTANLVQQQFANARVIAANGNIGYAAGNNLGFAAARAPWLLMLNPDTEARAGALQAMLAAAGRRPELGMLAPHLVFADGGLQH
ncbi:MAG: glycosyltransferase, partial [Chloroflexi bacterium]